MVLEIDESDLIQFFGTTPVTVPLEEQEFFAGNPLAV